MSGGQEREILAGLIEGLEAHGVNVTPDMRDTLDERLASGLAKAVRGSGVRRTESKEIREHTEGYLDLWTGVFASAEGAAAIERLAPWPERVRVIANGLCLAELSGNASLHICDIALLWPVWFKVATGPSDLARLWHPVGSRIKATLNRFGHDIQRVGKYTWQVTSIGGAGNGVVLSATAAADDIRAARVALLSKDYEAAGRHAVRAIDRCPVATAAHWLVAEVSRGNLCTIDRTRQLQSAEALLDLRRSVQSAVYRLKEMPSHARRAMRHDWVVDQVDRMVEELTTTAPLCAWAKQTLNEAVDGGEDK